MSVDLYRYIPSQSTTRTPKSYNLTVNHSQVVDWKARRKKKAKKRDSQLTVIKVNTLEYMKFCQVNMTINCTFRLLLTVNV
jgi:hypothetical protein